MLINNLVKVLNLKITGASFLTKEQNFFVNKTPKIHRKISNYLVLSNIKKKANLTRVKSIPTRIMIIIN